MERDEELIAISRKRLAEKCKRIASSLTYNKKKNPSGLNLFRKYTRMDKVQKTLYKRLREKELRESRNISLNPVTAVPRTPAAQTNTNVVEKSSKHENIRFDEHRLNACIDQVKSSNEHAQNTASRKRKRFHPIDGFISAAQLRNDFTQSRFDQLPLKQRPTQSKPTTLSINPNSNKKIVDDYKKIFQVASHQNQRDTAEIAERKIIKPVPRNVVSDDVRSSKDYIVPYPQHIDRTDPLGLNDDPHVRRMAYVNYNPSLIRSAGVRHVNEYRYAPVLLNGRFSDHVTHAVSVPNKHRKIN